MTNIFRQLRCCKWLEGYGKAKQDVLIQYQTHQSAMEPWEPIEITKNVGHLLHVKMHIVGDLTLDCDMQLKMSSNHEMNTTKGT